MKSADGHIHDLVDTSNTYYPKLQVHNIRLHDTNDEVHSDQTVEYKYEEIPTKPE
jgi:hypothetical protein